MNESKITLRPCQQEAVDKLFKYWEKRTRPCLVSAPTAFGKSITISEIVRRAGEPTLILQPSKEILEQNYEKLQLVGVPESQISICSASVNSWKIGQFTLATIGTIYKHAEYCQHFKIVIVDEADVVDCSRTDSMFMKFFAELPPTTRIVGLTGSMWRNQTFSAMYEDPKVYCRPLTRIFCKGGDKEWYGKWFWSGGIVYNTDIPTMQKLGYLSPTEYCMAETDWSFVRNVPGRVDFDTNGMERWCDIEANTSRFTQAVTWCMRNRYKTIIFSPNIDMNFRLKNVIHSLGGTVETMDSDHDSKKSREEKMDRFRNGEFQFLVNVGMVGRGVDVPSVDAIVLARPTKSLSLYCQFIGRALRKDPNNPDKVAQILDLGGNVERFGKVEDVKLEKQKVKKNGWEYSQDVITIKKNGKKKIWERVS